MLIAFQILLIFLIVLFSIGVLGDKDKQNRMNYTAIVVASVLAMCFSLWIGVE
jgi:uncharacterized membrane protein